MGDIIELFDFVWKPLKCWKFQNDDEFYFGHNYNTSNTLRFTTLIYNEYFDCGIDTDILYTFSKFVNLRLNFIEPEIKDTGKLGTKINGKWVNGSMALLDANKTDYLADDTFLNPYIYDDIKSTHILDDIYQISMVMKKFTKSNGLLKLFNQFELYVWIAILISLLIFTIFGSMNAYFRNIFQKNNFQILLIRSVFHLIARPLSLSGSVRNFGKLLLIFWIFFSLNIREFYKSVMLSNLVKEPKIWYTNIKELVESEAEFDTYIPKGTLTHSSLLERSESDSEDSVYFKLLLDRTKLSTYSEAQRIDNLQDLCDGNNALIMNSLKAKRLEVFKSECDLSLNDLKYDQMNIIRIIRKDYVYSDQLTHITNILVETGINRHWDELEQESLPLILRELKFAFKQNGGAKRLSLNDLNWTFYLFVIGINISLVSVFIEFFHNKYININK